MKATKLLFGACALLAFSACSDDKDSGNAPDYTESAYIRVNILGNNSTVGRAEGDDEDWTADDNQFEHGSGDENVINNVTLIFYDARGNYVASADITNGDETTNPDANVDVLKSVEAKVGLPDGKFPSFMMAFVNPINIDDIKTSTLNAIPDRTRTTYSGANGKFAMNNSVYYSKDGELQRAVAVSQANFYQDPEDAANHDAVDVYVERLAAKISLKFDDNASQTQTGTLDGATEGSTKKLTFHVEGWGVNARAKECYLSKRFIGKTFAEMNKDFNSFYWNDYLRFRSYWAISPFYASTSTNKFPDVSDDIRYKDNSGNVQSNADNYTFTYRAYKDLTREFGKSTYAMENTIHSSYYNGSTKDVNTSAALISVVVKGYYTLGDSDAKQTFYLYGGKIYEKAEYLKLMANYGAVIGRLAQDGKTWMALDNTDKLDEIFTIAHPTKAVAGDTKVEENKVTIQWNKNYNGTTKYYYKNADGEVVEITAANRAQINTDLQANCGLATAYTDGAAYFNVPIRHIAPAPKSDNETWAAGSFGVVRNHHYVITIDGFADLSTATIGHGVFDPEQPIVPPSDPNDEYGIKANINVLSWRIVKHDVTLGE